MKRLLSLFICIMMVTACVPVLSGAENLDLVIIIYMTGSDLESDGGAASADLTEMIENFPIARGIRIIAMVSGANKWKLDIPYGETSIYEITETGMNCVGKSNALNMGDPETLTRLLEFSETHYPADRYGLIIWDHGAGPLVGVCFDETNKVDGVADRLTMEELDLALGNSPFASKKLSFIGFDACLMSTLEVAFTVAPYAEYMIASQDTVPPEGWDYAFLHNLTGTESGDVIGKSIVSFYGESRKSQSRPVTLSCLDLSKTDMACSALDSFFGNLESAISTETYIDYTGCRAASKRLGTTTTSQYDLVDLLDLLSLYEEEHLADTSVLAEAVQDMIVCHFSLNDDYTNGISIYYPFDNKTMYETVWSDAYDKLRFAPKYQSFVRRISKIFMGDALLNWKSSYQVLLQQKAGTVKVSVDLTPEELKNLSRSRLLVVEEIQKGVFRQIYADYNNLRHFNDAVSAVYHGEALYVIDENGGIVAGPITYYPVDGGIAVYGWVSYEIDYLLPFTIRQKMEDVIRLVYHQEDNGSLTLTDVMVIADDETAGSLYLPAAVDLTKCPDLVLFNAGPSSVTSLDHQVDFNNPVRLDPSKGAPSLAFLPVYGSNNRYAYIRMTDLQGNDTFSEIVEIPNPTLIPISSEQVFLDNEQYLLTLKSAEMVSGYQSGIKCVFTLKNRLPEPFHAIVSGLSFDITPVHDYAWNAVSFAPDEEDEIVVFVSSESIRSAAVHEAESLVFNLCFQAAESSVDYSVAVPIQLDLSIFLDND